MTIFLLAIVGFFIISIFLREFFPNICAICLAVSATWLAGLGYLLLSNNSDVFDFKLALGILMGGSAVGSMYFLFRDSNRVGVLFKLPYLLSVFGVIYFILLGSAEVPTILIMFGLWLVFGLIYLFKNTHFKSWSAKIIECCKNW